MEFTPFERDVMFDWFRAAKRSLQKMADLFEKSVQNQEKLNILLEKLLQMLENE